MNAIYIPHLAQATNGQIVLEIDQFLENLETLMPVRGGMKVQHQGNYLSVSAKAETIITLACDRCLQNYNHRLSLNESEIIWLDLAADIADDDAPLERETNIDDLVETLSPKGHFYPDRWLYEQLCLALPPRQLCDRNCTGIVLSSEASDSTPHDTDRQSTDRRWASLEALKKQLQD